MNHFIACPRTYEYCNILFSALVKYIQNNFFMRKPIPLFIIFMYLCNAISDSNCSFILNNIPKLCILPVKIVNYLLVYKEKWSKFTQRQSH